MQLINLLNNISILTLNNDEIEVEKYRLKDLLKQKNLLKMEVEDIEFDDNNLEVWIR